MSRNPLDMRSDEPVAERIDYMPVLEQMMNLIKKQNDAGKSLLRIDVIATVGTTASLLYRAPKPVRGGTIMNLSATDTVTLVTSGEESRGIPKTGAAAGTGYVLNPATVAGQGGGCFNFGNIDLSTITVITNTNVNQSVCVVYYI